MKKFIAAALITLACATGANAQEKKATSLLDNAKSQVALLTQKVTLDEHLKASFVDLMVIKQERLATAKNEAEKEELYKIVERKIMVSLTPEQQKQLINDPELLKRLTR